MAYRGYPGWEQDFFDYEPPEWECLADTINREYCDRCDTLCDADGVIQIDGSYLCPDCNDQHPHSPPPERGLNDER